jgi:hypothetical protein
MEDQKQVSHLWRKKINSRSLGLGLLALGALFMVAPEVRGANPKNPNKGVPPGVPQVLPPFAFNPAPQPFLQTMSPFAIIGFIQNATLDPTCASTDPLCGGTVTVNDITVTVPRNTILQMPAFAITWADLFRGAPLPYGPTQTGLAINDVPRPFTTYEINLQGNRVITPTSDQYIAGLILLSEQSLNASQGFINFIDYANHEMWVGSTLAAKTGSRIRINTPQGRYGTPDPLADKRFTADEDNPTIQAQTGYPMCLPRVDPAVGVDSLCPQWNRPRDPFTGAFATIFTMNAATAGVAGADGITHQAGFPTPTVKPDPFEQAPFEVGDYVTYSGNLINDVVPCVAGQPLSSCQYISAHTINANLSINTFPGSKPAYVTIEAQLLGIGSVPNPLFPQEGVERLVISSFTTDSTQLVDFYAVDVDPVTGNPSHRFYGTADPFGPPISPLKGRARIRTFVGNFLPPTREMVAASRTLTGGAPVDSILPTITFTANGLRAGYYRAPTFGFVLPENLGVGNPQVPIPFETFPFIVNGFGPYVPNGFTAASTAQATVVVGQLNPWPGLNAPPVADTLGLTLLQPPVPNAGAPQTVTSGSTVTLNGAGSIDPNVPALPISFTWVQSAGPAVVLLNSVAAHPTFTAPVLPSGSTPVTLTFQLAVCNGFTCSGISSVNITVVAATAGPTISLGVAPGQNVLPSPPAPGAPVIVTLTATVTGTATAPTFTQTSGPVVTLTGTGATRTFNSPTVAQLTAAGLTLPATLTFKATVGTVSSTVNVFVGGDTISVAAAGITYHLAKSVLTITGITTNVPKGAANITMTPLGFNGQPLAAGIVLNYDPIANMYFGEGNVNPTPNSVKFTSSFGGTLISPILSILPR